MIGEKNTQNQFNEKEKEKKMFYNSHNIHESFLKANKRNKKKKRNEIITKEVHKWSKKGEKFSIDTSKI